MADVKFKGIVEKLLGTKGVKIVEKHNRKNDAGEWETVGRTFFTVWCKDEPQPAVGDLVTVTGSQKTVAEEYLGKMTYNLHVYASSIVVEKSFGSRAKTDSTDWDDVGKYGAGTF